MSNEDQKTEKTTTLQLMRQSIRSRNLRRLKESFERPWAQAMVNSLPEDANPSAVYLIFHEALQGMQKQERKRAFQWTWDCYHPLMSDLGKALEDIDGFSRQYRP